MQTGQNSIASENSLPQLGQVRRDSALMFLTALQFQFQLRAKPRSGQSSETDQHHARDSVIPLHE
jgi:hypothetical protein